jgi:hypothetical protein
MRMSRREVITDQVREFVAEEGVTDLAGKL